MQYWDGIQWTEQHMSMAELPVSQLPPPAPLDGEHRLESPRGRQVQLAGVSGAIFLILFGLTFLGIGSIPLASNLRDAVSSKPAVEATVVDLEWSYSSSRRSSSNSRSCSPVTNYTVDGQEYTAYSSHYRSPCAWSVGQTVEVLYDPANPQDSRVKDSGVGFTAALFPLIGLGIVGFGVTLGVRDLRARRKRAQAGQAD